MSPVFAWYFLSLNGRISRQEYWLGYLGIFVITLILRRRHEAAILHGESGVVLLLAVLVMILMWPMTTVYVKRLHDFNVSGWWLLIPTAVAAITGIAGTDPSNLIFSAFIVVTGLIPGSRGSNRFGADPVAYRGA